MSHPAAFPPAVREAILREACSRTTLPALVQNEGQDADMEAIGVQQQSQGQQGPQRCPDSLVSFSQERLEALREAVELQRRKNDFAWEQVSKDVDRLAKEGASTIPDLSAASPSVLREAEIALLDFRIEKLTKETSDLPPADTILVNEVRTRANLLDRLDQYDILVLEMEKEIENEKRGLQVDLQLRKDLDIAYRGLQKKQVQLGKKSQGANDENEAAAVKRKIRTTEKDLSGLLDALISTTNDLFPEARQRTKLRAFLDALMNRAWDHPAEPYVSTASFPSALVSFLVSGNIALEHPRDSTKLRLVPFQRAAR